MEFSQFVEYVTTDGVHHVAPQQHELDNPLVLETLRGAYQHVASLGRAVSLSVAELDALKTAAPYHADVVAHEMVSNDPAEIVERLIVVRSYPEWHVGLDCVAVDAERTVGVYFNPADANLYKCYQPHKAQADWRPDLPGLGALWGRFYEDEWPEWVQPTGAHNAYQEGDKVTFQGGRYISLIDANVWSPTAYPQGWEYQGPA